ncbi:ABC transporter ATP-binding protein [Shinella sp. HZN7]|uniref:ABC transporter ATP-binding protein n=1 Tax=Shinella sp. (strain HZN7) TaxID=879274 RepID=UPI0007DAAE44|nr:ABC transporter ATP-binding protein [Shinella sp. HZN7]ANH05608.1 spermidine/putrescine ABC transporter ATP-binding protein [Shinella sp. HZN7]
MPPDTTTGTAGASRAAIELIDIRKAFGAAGGETTYAVDRMNLTIKAGEFFTFLGPSGCGKTTTLRMIAGFEEPTSGRLLLDGKEVTGVPAHQRNVNTVFQSYALFPHLTVSENVGFGLSVKGVAKDEIRQRVQAALESVHMGHAVDRKPSALSGGQQQRVALARALINRPSVLLLDEPFGALDLKLRREMQMEVKEMQRKLGITFIFVTHDQEEALTMSDRIAVMNNGTVQQVGGPADIYERPANRFTAGFIGDMNLIDARVLGRSDDRLTVEAAGGRFEMPCTLPVQAGDPCTLAIRPEALHFVEGEAGGTIRFAGTVSGAVYIGTDTVYGLTLADGTRLHARLRNGDGRPTPQTGEPGTLACEPAAIRLLTQ